MKGYQLTFYTHQGRQHSGKPVAQWLMEIARSLKVSGATVIPASEGFGHGGKMHSAHFFELSEQPLMVSMVLTEAEKQQLLERLEQEDASIFYIATACEFGFSGKQSD